MGADISVTAYVYDASKPHRLTGATIGGKTCALSHDADGNITKYDCTSATCVDDRFVEWNGRNLPKRITVGGSKADATPAARDEFAYGPDGARYRRKTTYADAGGARRIEHAHHVGSFEELPPPSGAKCASIGRTRVTDGVRHVRTTTVETDADGKRKSTAQTRVESAHTDHPGSAEAITDAAGSVAHDPHGSRRRADWAAALAPAEIQELAASPGPRERGRTGHEHLDRTGLIHLDL